MIDTAFRIENLSSDMSTAEIRGAFDDISYAIATLKDAIDNRLEALGFDEEQDSDNPEINELLDYRDALENCCL